MGSKDKDYGPSGSSTIKLLLRRTLVLHQPYSAKRMENRK